MAGGGRVLGDALDRFERDALGLRQLDHLLDAEPRAGRVGRHPVHAIGAVVGADVGLEYFKQRHAAPVGRPAVADAAQMRRAGAAQIVAADIADLPLQCARQMGADETINLRTDAGALDKYKASD